jgi:hypothetical protein
MKIRIKPILHLVLAACLLFRIMTYAAATTTVEVYKSPTCGCCAKWVDHMRDHGFTVKTHDVGNKEIRKKMGLSESLGSCHTAIINGYVFEGHIPAPDIIRFLRERPKALGLAVPDMPHGSPGMEGSRVDPYSVLLVKERGDTRRDAIIYNRYDPYAKSQAQPAQPDAEGAQGGSVMRLK